VTVLAVGLVAAPEVGAADEAVWSVVELSPLHAGDYVEVHDLNDAGVSVGRSDSAVVLWDSEGSPTELEVPEDCEPFATLAISDTEHVGGTLFCDDEQGSGAHAAHWDPDGSVDLAPIESFGFGVEDGGIVVGRTLGLAGEPQGSVPDGPIAYLEGHPVLSLPNAGSFGAAMDLTTWGYVVGGLSTIPGVPQTVAVGWYGDQVFPLARTGLNTGAVKVNEHGVALLDVWDEDDEHRGFLVVPGQDPVPLSAGGDQDVVRGLNDASIAVGSRVTAGESEGRFYAGSFSVPLRDAVTDADAAKYGLFTPLAINNSAWVVGTDDDIAWLLKPPTS
jgi:hypothetical protein